MLTYFKRELWATRIYQARFNMELTQQEFGNMYGITATAISYWESCTCDPSAEHFLAICIDNHWNMREFLDYCYV